MFDRNAPTITNLAANLAEFFLAHDGLPSMASFLQTSHLSLHATGHASPCPTCVLCQEAVKVMDKRDLRQLNLARKVLAFQAKFGQTMSESDEGKKEYMLLRLVDSEFLRMALERSSFDMLIFYFLT